MGLFASRLFDRLFAILRSNGENDSAAQDLTAERLANIEKKLDELTSAAAAALGDAKQCEAAGLQVAHVAELASIEKKIATTVAETQQLINAMILQSSQATSKAEGQLDAWRAELASGIKSESRANDNQLAEMRLWLEKISAETTNATANLEGHLTNARAELKNLKSHIDGQVEILRVEFNNRLATSTGGLEGRFNTLLNEALPKVCAQSHEVLGKVLELHARGADRSRWKAQAAEQYAPAKLVPFDDVLKQAKQAFPQVFEPWHQRLETTRNAFAFSKVGNAANDLDLYSRMFKSFVEGHIRGRVLDVGCGVFGRPHYLQSYAPSLISGLEPLPIVGTPDFECVAGLNEFLPWPDAAFSTVINATSLDHVMSLDASLDEMVRVLAPDGVILLWIGSNSGAPEYTSGVYDPALADRFHLFHFDTAWFDPMLVDRFDMLDRMEFVTAAFSHVFYALKPRA